MSGKVLKNEVVKIRNDENYCCYDWIIKFSCICDVCFCNDSYKSIINPGYFSMYAGGGEWDFVLRINDSVTPITVTFRQTSNFNYPRLLRIGVRNKKNEICHTTEYKNLNNALQWVHPNYIRNCNYWSDGVLKVVVEVFNKPIIETLNHAEKVLKNLQQSGMLADVTLVIGEQEFRAHKAILAAQSSVFLAMFEHDMKEKIENKVIIEDISHEVMQIVLNYTYTASADNERLKDLASDVLVAADKYALEGLVKICEEVLVQGLSKDNAIKVLQTANSYKLDYLKKAAVTFIAREIKDLMETDEFNDLAKSSMDLIKEIFLRLKE